MYVLHHIKRVQSQSAFPYKSLFYKVSILFIFIVLFENIKIKFDKVQCLMDSVNNSIIYSPNRISFKHLCKTILIFFCVGK